jgi:predicted phage terminase large subunit-like protein
MLAQPNPLRTPWDILATSNTTTLADEFSLVARRHVSESEHLLGHVLNDESQSVGRWEVTGRGVYRCAGAGTAIAGRRADRAIVDDAIRGSEQANSATQRDKIWIWYVDDLRQRVKPDGGICHVQTRWHREDLCGRILPATWNGESGDIVARDGETWHVICLPQLSTRGDDPLGRAEGEPLWPEWMSLASCEQMRATMSSQSWASLHQQSPQVVGGNLVQSKWFPLYGEPPAMLDYRLITVDTAVTAKEHSDFTCAQLWGKAGGRIYLLDQWMAKVEAADIRSRVLAFWNKSMSASTDLNGHLRAIEIEEAASGTQLVQEIKRAGGIPVRGIKRTKDKYQRFTDCASHMETGNVCLPANAPYLSDLLAEFEAFSANDSHLHDDALDCTMSAIESMLLTGKSAAALWGAMSY